MIIQEIIKQFQNAVVQIANKTGTGTGFYLQEYNIIVTNNHVVRGSRYVTIKGRNFGKQRSQVIYADEKYDLAFLLPPDQVTDFPDLKLGDYNSLKDGDEVVAIGHPYGLNYTATQGVVSRVDRVQQGIRYIQIDAAINPGNSGGPLVDDEGAVVGVNTFIIKGGDNLGFALPVSYLRDALDTYKPFYGELAIACPSCSTLVTEQNLDNGKYCPNCGTKIDFPRNDIPQESTVGGIAKTVELILQSLGKNPELARTGSNRWEVEAGSARIKIAYNPDNFFIVSDAHLCILPKQDISPLYVFMLQENYKLRGKLFSMQGDNIVLSALIYDPELTVESGAAILKDLFERADYYDNLLEERFGCRPILQER